MHFLVSEVLLLTADYVDNPEKPTVGRQYGNRVFHTDFWIASFASADERTPRAPGLPTGSEAHDLAVTALADMATCPENQKNHRGFPTDVWIGSFASGAK